MSSKANKEVNAGNSDTETLQSVSLSEPAKSNSENLEREPAVDASDDDDDLVMSTSEQEQKQQDTESASTSNSKTGTATTGQQENKKTEALAAGRSFHLPASGTEVYIAAPHNKTDTTSTATEATEYKQEHISTESDLLAILLTNSLGISSKNNLALAHLYADRLGCQVVMPDLFEGDPVTTGGNVLEEDEVAAEETGAADTASTTAAPSTDDQPKGHHRKSSLLSQVKTFAVSTVKGFLEDMWAAKHTPEQVLPIVQSTVVELISVYKPRKVVVIGYSFGARYVVPLLAAKPPQFVAAQWASSSSNGAPATDDTSATKEGENAYDRIVCGAVIHPSLLDPADFQHVVKPVHLVYSKDDELLPEPIIRDSLRTLDERKTAAGSASPAPFETTVYDNDAERKANPAVESLPHGFAVPGDYPPSVVGDRPQRVFSVITSWISEHL